MLSLASGLRRLPAGLLVIPASLSPPFLGHTQLDAWVASALQILDSIVDFHEVVAGPQQDIGSAKGAVVEAVLSRSLAHPHILPTYAYAFSEVRGSWVWFMASGPVSYSSSGSFPCWGTPWRRALPSRCGRGRHCLMWQSAVMAGRHVSIPS